MKLPIIENLLDEKEVDYRPFPEMGISKGEFRLATLNIISLLEMKDVLNLRLVCKDTKELIDQPMFWREILPSTIQKSLIPTKMEKIFNVIIDTKILDQEITRILDQEKITSEEKEIIPSRLELFSNALRNTYNTFTSFFEKKNTGKTSPVETSFNDLPNEVVLLIFSNLGIQDLRRNAGVSKEWKSLSEDIYLWKTHIPRFILESKTN